MPNAYVGVICTNVFVITAVRLVMEKRPISMLGSMVEIKVLTTLLDKDENLDSVQIRGFQKGLADDILAMSVDGIVGLSGMVLIFTFLVPVMICRLTAITAVFQLFEADYVSYFDQ